VHRAPDPRLGSLLHRELLGFTQHQPGFRRWLEPPRAALTLMVDFDGELREDGAVLPDAWVAGLSDRPSLVEFGSSYASLDLELTPLGAYRVLGRPLSELAGTTVPLRELFGAPGEELAGRLREQVDWDARFDLVEAFLLARAAEGPAPAPFVAWAWELIAQRGGQIRVAELAAEIGCSRRHLQSRFSEQVGLPPKTVARLVRFERVCTAVRRAPGRWAEVAAAAGYADQSHLSRDFRELAGTTPSEFLARLIPGGGVIGD
jgi:AraC-like DNA-binding protein